MEIKYNLFLFYILLNLFIQELYGSFHPGDRMDKSLNG